MKLNRNSVLYNASVMTLAGVLLQIIGFVYRIYLSRMAGPEGLGVYRLILPVHSVSISIAISGVRMAATSLSAELELKKSASAVRLLTRLCIGIFLGIFVALAIPVTVFRDAIGGGILGDSRTAPALPVMMVCILLTGFELILESIFLGLKKTKYTAVSNVLEQLTQMAGVIWMLSAARSTDCGTTALLICAAMVCSEVPVVIWLGLSYRRVVMSAARQQGDAPGDRRAMLGRIRDIAIPVTCSSAATTLISSAGTVLLPQRLMAAGLTNQQALEQLGIISGMALPLLTLPGLFLNALSTVLVPTISHTMAAQKPMALRRKIRKAVQAVGLLGLPAMAVLLPLASDLSLMLYQQSLSQSYLMLLGLSVVFLYYQTVTISILNGLKLQRQAMINVILGEGIELVLIYLLAAQPQLHIYGYMLGTLTCGVLITCLNLRLIRKKTGVLLGAGKLFLQPLLAAVILGLFSNAIYHSFGGLGQLPAMGITVGLCLLLDWILLQIMGFRPLRYWKSVCLPGRAPCP